MAWTRNLWPVSPLERMTVLARSKSGVGRMKRRRDGRLGRLTGRVDAAPGDSARPTSEPAATSHAEPTASQHAETADSAAIARRRREAGRSQDLASYTCQCGFVFEALVSTSVDCPNCGDPQAW
jgi:hypothetical protein